MSLTKCQVCGKSLEAHTIERNPNVPIRCHPTGSNAVGFDGDDVVALFAALGTPLTQMQAVAWKKVQG